MKRMVAVLLMAAVLLFGSASAVADEVDLSKWSDDEVVALLSQVQQEIATRHIEKSAQLPAGSYLVGTDLPVGTYTVYCKYEGSWWADIYVIEDGGEGDTTFSGTVYGPDNEFVSTKGEGTWTVTLHDGDLFKCSDEVTLTISSGVKFH
jgi:hypothetical protein